MTRSRALAYSVAVRGGNVVALLLLAVSPPALLHAQREESVVFYYSFEEDGDGFVVDAGPNGLSASLNGPVQFSERGAGWNGGRAMDFGEFDNGAFLEVFDAFAFQSLTANDSFTIAFFQLGGNAQPVAQWTFHAANVAEQGVRQIGSHSPWENGNVYLDVAGCCAGNQRINALMPADTIAGNWTHLAYTKEGSRTAIWINGQEFHSSDEQGGAKLPLGTIDRFRIGAGPDGDLRSYHGMLDEFIVWDVALTADENAGLAQSGPTLVPTLRPLELQVDPRDGYAQIASVVEQPDVATLHAYEILGQQGTFDFSQWSVANLAARGVDAVHPTLPGQSWSTVNAAADQLFEAYLLGGSAVVPGEALPIGKILANDGGEPTLVFNYVSTTDFAPTPSAGA